MSWTNLKAAIAAAIKTNNNQEITGAVLQNTLNSIVNSVGANATFAGIATPSTNPGTPDGPVFWIATQSGQYSNFNNIELQDGISLLMWNGTWTSEIVMYGDGGVFDISAYHATGGTLATYANLSSALDSNNGGGVPQSLQKGGMSIKFVQSSDHKYVQFRLMGDEFSTTVANWQSENVKNEAIIENTDLVNGDGIVKGLEFINNKIGTYTPKLGAFSVYKTISENNTKAYLEIHNPKTTICLKDGYLMSVFKPNADNDVLSSVTTNIKEFDCATLSEPYIWFLIKDAFDSTRSLENDNLEGLLYIKDSISQSVFRNKQEIGFINDSAFNYVTKDANTDFTESGAYKISSAGLISYIDSANMKHKIIHIEELSAINVVGTLPSIVNRLPAIIYLKDNSPIDANVIKGTEQWGTVATEFTNFVRFNSKLIIPEGAKYALVNNYVRATNTSVTYKEPKGGNINPSTDKEQFLLKDWNYGYYKIDENDGLTFGDSTNWLNVLLKLDDNGKSLFALDVVASKESVGVPAIIYLSDSNPIEANRLGQQYGTDGNNNYRRFNDVITIPEGATYAIINCAKTDSKVSTLTFKESANSSVDRLLIQIQLVEKKKVVTVDINGNGDFTTIKDAARFTSDGDTILIYPGVYDEYLTLDGTERHLVGVCREKCILTNGLGDYEHQPLRINKGSVENLTIIADTYDSTISDPTTEQVRTDYAVHIEYANNDPYTLTIRNCTLHSKWNAAVGLGLRYNQTVIIENCDLISDCVLTWSSGQNRFVSMGGLFFHNDAIDSTHLNDSGWLILKNNRIYGVNNALCISGVADHPYATVEYINNNLMTKNNGVTNIVEHWVTGDNGRIIKAVNSYGNNIAELNA